MDKETEDFLKKTAGENTNPKAMFFASAIAGISGLYCGFVDKAFKEDSDMAMLLMSMVNSGIIRANSNSTDEAIAKINKVSDMMKDMVIKLENAVNKDDLNSKGD